VLSGEGSRIRDLWGVNTVDLDLPEQPTDTEAPPDRVCPSCGKKMIYVTFFAHRHVDDEDGRPGLWCNDCGWAWFWYDKDKPTTYYGPPRVYLLERDDIQVDPAPQS